MELVFLPEAWQDYLYWQKTDKKVLRKINTLIKDIHRAPFEGLGSPEALKHNLSGYWSRRITLEHRIVYRINGNQIRIVQCRYHY
ncbi:MAG: Txe/YoeB family addiction module toxin [Salibacteraceae bacterium]